VGATTAGVCADCAAQTFQDTPGSTTCLDCPGGTECTDRNRRRCWKAKDLKNPRFTPVESLVVEDKFSTSTVDLKGPSLFCSPAGLNGQPVANPEPRQCCYKVKGARLDPAATVATSGTIGGALELELGTPSLVCEPCTRAPLP
jgi:hypothetical protein